VNTFLWRHPFRASARSLAALALAVAVLGLGLFWGITAWQDHAALASAQRDETAGRFAEARDTLAKLAARRPGRDDVEYALGASEAALGHVQPALDAWARVPIHSPLSRRAALDRARLAVAQGHLAAAEDSLERIGDLPDPISAEAANLARQADFFSGRAERINARVERRWRSSADPVAELRAHWLYETQPLPLDAMSAALDRFGRAAPDDDRVWLGRADLARRAGRYDEADSWLSRCEARRPHDPDVMRVRLAWALDAGRADAATRALAQLPAARFAPDEVAMLTARLAALRGDAPAERAALQRRVAFQPGDAAAWARLGELGAAESRTEARRRKAEIDRASDRYRTLMGLIGRGERSSFPELARIAETLGRCFEAQGWWTLRARQAPNDAEAKAALARLAHAVDPAPSSAGKTLMDLIPDAVVSAQSHPDSARDVPRFRNEAESAGLRFLYDNEQTQLRRLPESIGGGIGLLDFDGDGWLDVYAVQGGRLPPEAKPNGMDGDHLFRNRHDGTFEDVTIASGIAAMPRGYGHGVAVGDYDNDGRPDLFLTRWRSYALYRNKGDGTFEDATQRAGLGGARGWPTSAAFGDLDNDGDLDLYVCHYVQWDLDQSPPCPDPDHPGHNVYCVPRAFEAEPDRVYRNDGGRFVDVTKEAGIVDTDGRGLGVVIADLDADGRPDIFVANDMTANNLHHNLGGFRFADIGVESGVASNAGGGYQAGMGIACGDLNGDGRPDLVVTNFYGESATFYENLGDCLFADRSAAVGLTAPTRFLLGFGASFLDANNDGRLDLALANGHVNDYSPAIPYAMPAQLFLGGAGGRLTDASACGGACWTETRVGRGLAVGDLDNDGRTDVLILSQNGPLALFHNLGPSGHFLTLQLRGTTSNRDGVGAVVRVTSPGVSQTHWRIGGGSFLSTSDSRIHIGLGTGSIPSAVAVEVRWPSGKIDRHDALKIDGFHQLVERETQK
jgi:enediyne biosynthesis protein E4